MSPSLGCHSCTTHGAGAARLFDLVKVRDPALGAAFYYAMRDTVVAKDLEQASRIAYGADKRWAKVVTLKVWYMRACTRLLPRTSKQMHRHVYTPARSAVGLGDAYDHTVATTLKALPLITCK